MAETENVELRIEKSANVLFVEFPHILFENVTSKLGTMIIQLDQNEESMSGIFIFQREIIERSILVSSFDDQGDKRCGAEAETLLHDGSYLFDCRRIHGHQ